MQTKKLKVMNEKFNPFMRTNDEFNAKTFVNNVEERNEKIRAISKVREEIYVRINNLSEKELEIARVIIETGTQFAIDNE